MQKILTLFIAISALSACSHHNIELRANHFLTPVVAEEPLSGYAYIGTTSISTITLIEDKAADPPLRDKVHINNDLSSSDLMPLENISFDAGVTVHDGLELGLNGNVLALKYQFLNRHQTNTWVSSMFLGAGLQEKDSSSSSTSGSGTTKIEAESNIKILRVGASIGHRYSSWTPYASYIYENFDVTTDISNTHGKFNGLKDSGNHHSVAIGLTTTKPGFSATAEYSFIQMDWNRAEKETAGALGGRIGFSW